MFDLGKLLQGVGNAVNPFDGGKGFSDAYAPAPKKKRPEPATTPKPGAPLQVRQSMSQNSLTVRPQPQMSGMQQDMAQRLQVQQAPVRVSPKVIPVVGAKPVVSPLDRGLKSVSDAFTKTLPVVAQELVKAPITVAKAAPKFVADTAVGMINEAGNRMADFGEAGAEVIREATGQNAQQYRVLNEKSENYKATTKALIQKAQQERDPVRRERLIKGAEKMWVADMDVQRLNNQQVDRGLAATDPRKTLVNAGVTALDVATLGRGSALMKGFIQPAATNVTRQSVAQLARNAGRVGGEGMLLGGSYGGMETARNADATAADYATNIATGAAVGAGAGIGLQIATPVIAKGVTSSITGAQKGVQAFQDDIRKPVVAAAEQASGLPRLNVLNDNEAYTLSDFADIAMKRYTAKGSDQNKIVMQARNAAKNAGLDLSNKTPREIDTMVSKYLEARDVFKTTYSRTERQMLQGGYIDPSWASNRPKKQVDLAEAIEGGSDTPVSFGNLSKRQLKEANEILASKGHPLLTSNELLVHPNVVKKLADKRVNIEGLSPEKVADIANSAIYNSKSKVGDVTGASKSVLMSNKKSTVQNNAYIGSFEGKGSLKSVYPSKIKSNTSDGRSTPSSSSTNIANPRQAERLSDVQSAITNVSDNGANVKSKATLGDYVVPTSTKKKVATSSDSYQKDRALTELRNNTAPQQQLSRTQSIRNTQENASRSSRKMGLETPLLDNMVQNRRTSTNSTPEIDTKQYVRELAKAQKEAGKSGMGLKDKASDFKEKFIDDLAPIEDRLNKAIKNGTKVDPKDNITYQLDRSRRAEGIMNAYVRDNGLDKVIQNVKNTNEFDQYLIARHAKELGDEVTTGRDSIKDAALVKQLDAEYGGAAKELYKYNQKLLDSSVDYGLISKETAASLKKQYPEYVPFNRIFNEEELSAVSGGNGKGNASISQQGVVKKIKGSKRAISSPLNSIIDKTRVVVEQGERNKAAQMLASYKDIEGNPFNLKELSPNETIGSRHTIAYLDNGKKRVFETDKDISDAAKNMTKEEIGMWGRIAAVPARVLRGGATTLNVGFAGANVVKDVVGAAINSRHPFRIADPEAMGKALASALHHNGKYYQELMREGVTGTSFDMYRNPLKSNVGELRSHKNIGTRAAYNVLHPTQWVRTLENTIGRSEDFGRALQYYSNKKGFKGEDANILAADQARSNSTNFFRHGSTGKNINLAIPYWNAGVQGARIMTRRTKERPVQTIAKLGLVIAAPSAMIAMNNYGDEKKRAIIEDIQAHEKDGYIIIVGDDAVFNEKTGKYDGVTKIPVPPQHIGVHRAIQDAVRSAFTGEAMDHTKNIGRLVEDYTTINPTDPKAMASRYIPQALKLVAEPMTNTNFFTGNKIVSDSQKNLPAPDQYGDYTSGTAKVIGKLTNGSPKMIDNTIRTGLGGAGQNLINATDNLLATTGAISKDEVQGKSIADSIKGRFSGASAISPSDKADKKLEEFKKQIITTDEYKNASQYDKSRILNRLETDVKAVEWNSAPAKGGQEKEKLTAKQQSLVKDGFKLDTYTNLDADSSSKTETYKEKYAKSQDDYKKNSASWSPIEKQKKEKDLEFLAVQKDYDNDTVSLYGMSKADVHKLVSTDKNGKKYVDDILKYGDALVDAGLIAKNKYRDKYGNILLDDPNAAKVSKSKGGSKAKGRKSGGSAKVSTFNAPVYNVATGNSALARLLGLTKASSIAKAPKLTARKASTSQPKVAIKKSRLRGRQA